METPEGCESAQDYLDVEYYLDLVMECAAEKRESRTRWVEIPEGYAPRPLDDFPELGRSGFLPLE